MDEPRLMAVDWSGRNSAEQRQAIWLAEGEKEMPQKSVEPVPTLSSTISRGPAASNSRAISARPATGR